MPAGAPIAAIFATLESPMGHDFRVVSGESVSTPERVPERTRRDPLRSGPARAAEWSLGRILGCP